MLKKCNLCNKRVRFISLEHELGDQLKSHGFPYSLSDFETLNYKEYSCPSCGSSDRDRLYKLYLDKFPLRAGSKIVDFAPASSLQNFLKSLDVDYRSADLFMEGVDDKIDITDMKDYTDELFDFFVCSHLLEHVDDRKALSELRRILKPGGRGILMTPIIDKNEVFDEDLNLSDIEERWRRFAQDDHVRLYSKKVFLERVRESGLKVQELGMRQLGIINFYKHGISLKSALYIVKRENDV